MRTQPDEKTSMNFVVLTDLEKLPPDEVVRNSFFDTEARSIRESGVIGTAKAVLVPGFTRIEEFDTVLDAWNWCCPRNNTFRSAGDSQAWMILYGPIRMIPLDRISPEVDDKHSVGLVQLDIE